MTPEQQAAANEFVKNAMLQAIQEGDEYASKLDALLAIPFIATSAIGQALRTAKHLYLTTVREQLREQLATAFDIEIDGPVVLPGGGITLPPPALTKLAFMERFTDPELGGLLAAREGDADVALFFTKFDMAQDVRLEDARTIAAVEMLETKGYIGLGRADVILGRPAGTFAPPAQGAA